MVIVFDTTGRFKVSWVLSVEQELYEDALDEEGL
jgi:hypothetical protein